MESGVRIAARRRSHPDLPVDVPLPAGITARKDLRGVTSIVRALGLEPACYDRLLDFFHSPALDLDKSKPAVRALGAAGEQEEFREASCDGRSTKHASNASSRGALISPGSRKRAGGLAMRMAATANLRRKVHFSAQPSRVRAQKALGFCAGGVVAVYG